AGAARAEAPERPVLDATGTVVLARPVAVTAAVGGRLARLTAREGDRVRKGDVLADLDDALARVAVQRAEALLRKAEANFKMVTAGAGAEAVARAKARVQEAEAMLENREARLSRFREAVKKGAVNEA